jgi:hypothetical protein
MAQSTHRVGLDSDFPLVEIGKKKKRVRLGAESEQSMHSPHERQAGGILEPSSASFLFPQRGTASNQGLTRNLFSSHAIAVDKAAQGGGSSVTARKSAARFKKSLAYLAHEAESAHTFCQAFSLPAVLPRWGWRPSYNARLENVVLTRCVLHAVRNGAKRSAVWRIFF